MISSAKPYVWLVLLFISVALIASCNGNQSQDSPTQNPPAQTGDDDNDNNDDTSSNVDDDDLSDDDSVADDDTISSECNIMQVIVNDPPEGNPLARRLTIKTDQPCKLSGMIASPDLEGYGLSAPDDSADGLQHELMFYGLAEEHQFNYQIFQAGREQEVKAEGDFHVSALPEDVIRPLRHTNLPEADPRTWVVMILPVNYKPHIGGVILILDRDANLRFYHEILRPEDRPLMMLAALNLLSDGSFVYDNLNEVNQVKLDGSEEVLYAPQIQQPYFNAMHHQFYIADDLSRSLLVFNMIGNGYGCDGVTPSTNVVGDGVVEVDANGVEQWRWSVFDHTDQIPLDSMDFQMCEHESAFWGSGDVDWTHGNSVFPVPGEDAFVVALRNVSRVVKIDRATGDIMWQAGRGLDFQWIGEEPPEEQWFNFEHDAKILPNGNLLLFDNHFMDTSPTWSRALEIQLDQEAMTARRVWEYRVSYTFAHGTVYRLEDGHTLITNGNGMNAYEVTADNVLVWSAEMPRQQDGSVGLLSRAVPYPALWTYEP